MEVIGQMSIGIGIDTGGTYTDAVIFDFESNKVLDSAKSLTTKYDLTIGIADVLDKLSRELINKASMVGLSTTMATNACVENKGGRAKLILWGVEKNTVEKFGSKYGLPDADEIYFQDSYPIYNGGYEKEADWELLKTNLSEWFGECDAVGVVELFAMNNNALIEKKTKDIIMKKLHIPVVCGNELFTDLNAVQRGSSVLLNARLIPIIEEFIKAIKSVLKSRNINVPVGIIRSDGSLMSEKFTSIYPVETVLCGPAASVMGGVKLTNENNALVVDMGGTTTDMAIVKDTIPVTVEDGVKIGKWRTFVKGLFVDTIGLGGDSAVRYKGGQLILDEARVIPLCAAASQYPTIKESLKLLAGEKSAHVKYIHEFYMLVKDINGNNNYTDEEQRFCKILKHGPLRLKEAASKMDKDVYHFDMKRLEKEGIVIRCGLTPTDMMHIKGDFDVYDTQASLLGATYVGAFLDEPLTPAQLADAVYKEVKKKMYVNIVRCLKEYSDPYYKKNGINEGVMHQIEQDFERAWNGTDDKFISETLKVSCTLIGIGAPIHIFLPDVARLLKTKAAIPEFSQVANALGAINGNIIVKDSIEIRPVIGGGYTAYGKEENKYFDKLNVAKEYAMKRLKDVTYKEAIERGSGEDITFKVDYNDFRSASKEKAIVYTGTFVNVTAMGRIKF